MAVYEKDLLEANKEIVISSPGINKAMVKWTLEIVQNRQLNGVNVKILTLPYETYPENRIEVIRELIIKAIRNRCQIKIRYA